MRDEELGRLILENAPDYAIMTVDPDGRISSWSSGAGNVLGYTAEEVVGRHFSLLFLEPDREAGLPSRELAKTLSDGRAEDTRWHLRKDGRPFWANGVSMRLSSGEGFLKVMRDETFAKVAEDQRILLLNELNHRIKNTLTIVQSITEQTLRSSGVGPDVREKLGERLLALSDAHNVLVSQNWAGADLQAIVEQALEPYRNGRNERLRFEGPPARLSPQQAVSISLAINELATNAVKYGALSNNKGRVRLTWNLAHLERGERSLTLAWEETGGPAVAPPAREGFGARMISRIFGGGAAGRARLDFRPTGLVCIIECILWDLEDRPIMPVAGDPSLNPPATRRTAGADRVAS